MYDTTVIDALNDNPISRKRVHVTKLQRQRQPRGIWRQSSLIRIGFARGPSADAG